MLQAAALVTQLPPGLAARVTTGLGGAQARRLADAMARVPHISSAERRAALLAFGIELQSRTGQAVTSLNRVGVAGLCQGQVEAAGGVLSDWLGEEELPAPQVAPSLIDLSEIEPGAKAAILLMCFPPEVSAQFFRELGPADVERITCEISRIPYLSPEARGGVIDELMHSAGLESLEEASTHRELVLEYLNQLLYPGNESPASPEWNGVRLVHGKGLRAFIHRPAVKEAIKTRVAELEAAWSCSLPPLKPLAIGSSSCHLSFRWSGQELLRTEIPLRGKPHDPLQLLLRALTEALASVVEAAKPKAPPSGVPALAVSSDLLAAIAALRAFHPNVLNQELSDLKSQDLARVAGGFLEFLSMPDESMAECLKESVNYAPGELLHQAGLAQSQTGWETATTVGILLSILPNGQPLLKELLPQLPRDPAIRLTEKLARLLYRKEERHLSLPEQYAAIGEFAEWHHSATARPGLPLQGEWERVADRIPLVWPSLTTESARLALEATAKEHPRRLAALLARYLIRNSGVGWVPAPVRAAHFVNSLSDPDRVRRRLLSQSYPIPTVAMDLAQIEKARREWSRGGPPVVLN